MAGVREYHVNHIPTTSRRSLLSADNHSGYASAPSEADAFDAVSETSSIDGSGSRSDEEEESITPFSSWSNSYHDIVRRARQRRRSVSQRRLARSLYFPRFRPPRGSASPQTPMSSVTVPLQLLPSTAGVVISTHVSGWSSSTSSSSDSSFGSDTNSSTSTSSGVDVGARSTPLASPPSTPRMIVMAEIETGIPHAIDPTYFNESWMEAADDGASMSSSVLAVLNPTGASISDRLSL